ncbi:MAG: hypothetical protein LBV54_04030 [Puniceicoccales bacterium]|nr:hypothetical protein [Puniceicoccales bacterium]
MLASATGFKLAHAFGGGMVLQREHPIPVWGEAETGTLVTVSFAGQKKTAEADTKGEWKLTLDPLPASSEGRTFVVSGGDEVLELKDVLVGEVWVCSGQSNMEMGIRKVEKGREEISKGNYPLIRLRYLRRFTADTRQTQIRGSEWTACSPESLQRGPWGGFTAVGFYFGLALHNELKVPVGIIQSAWGGTRIEPWTATEAFLKVRGLEKYAEQAKRASKAGKPSALYNAMIHPLIPYAIRGAIWYQGEANMGDTDYTEKMHALVQGWRTAWGQGDFPFYYVQLAPFIYKKNPETLAELWEQQTAALAIPNTGMAIINDIGNIRDIHPANKHDVGARLARLALSRTYGVKFTDDSGPIFKTARVDGGKVIVEFNYAASGLASRDGNPLTHFKVAGADGVFHDAQATIVGNTVEVLSPEVSDARQVRFAWREDAGPNLVNGEKLPASAFRWTAPVPEPVALPPSAPTETK